MQITKYGHACLHVVDSDASILIDPGNFSAGYENLTGLTAVLITHQHADHLDQAKLPALLAANPDAKLYTDHGSAEQLKQSGIGEGRVAGVAAGQTLDVGTQVRVHGVDHAIIHRDLPTIPNVGYFIGGRLLHPGDALTVVDEEVEILALPAAAPWMALKEAIDYHRAVGARTAFPIHDAIVAPPALPVYYGRFEAMGPVGARFVNIDNGDPIEL